MNIYRVTTEIYDYDEFDAVVVLADTAEEARELAFANWLPEPEGHWRLGTWRKHSTREPQVEVIRVGTADPGFKGGVFNPDGDSEDWGHRHHPRLVLGSFNAG